MKTVHFARALCLLLLLGGLSTDLLAAHANCSVAGGTLLKWPATGPSVWEMCWLSPAQSAGVQGSGLEVRDVHYKGILVAKRIHSPILFAEYRNGAGGNCYRDWKDANARFAATPAVRNQLGVPGSFLATTTCDVSKSATASHGSCPFSNLSPNPFTNADCMNSGVAIEDMTNAKLPEESYVQLTTQYSASWYQYASRIAFYANGDINPEFGYGNSNGTYNTVTHWHHNYWRIDFDIDGAEHDQIAANGVLKPTEFTDLRSLTGGPDGGPTHWEVSDSVQNFGYRITSGASDYTPVNESGRGLHAPGRCDRYALRQQRILRQGRQQPQRLPDGRDQPGQQRKHCRYRRGVLLHGQRARCHRQQLADLGQSGAAGFDGVQEGRPADHAGRRLADLPRQFPGLSAGFRGSNSRILVAGTAAAAQRRSGIARDSA